MENKYEKMLAGMMCCFAKGDPACSQCPYDTIDLRCKQDLFRDILDHITRQDYRILHLCKEVRKEKKQ